MKIVVATVGSNSLPVLYGLNHLLQQGGKAVLCATSETEHLVEPLRKSLAWAASAAERSEPSVEACYHAANDPRGWRQTLKSWWESAGRPTDVDLVYTGGTRIMSVAAHDWWRSLPQTDGRAYSVDGADLLRDDGGLTTMQPLGLPLAQMFALHEGYSIPTGRWRDGRSDQPTRRDLLEGADGKKADGALCSTAGHLLSGQELAAGEVILRDLDNPVCEGRSCELDLATVAEGRLHVLEMKIFSDNKNKRMPEIVVAAAEVSRRAQQLGGARARAGVVCRIATDDLPDRQGRLDRRLAAKVDLFGLADLQALWDDYEHKGQLPATSRVAKWLQGNDVR